MYLHPRDPGMWKLPQCLISSPQTLSFAIASENGKLKLPLTCRDPSLRCICAGTSDIAPSCSEVRSVSPWHPLLVRFIGTGQHEKPWQVSHPDPSRFLLLVVNVGSAGPFALLLGDV